MKSQKSYADDVRQIIERIKHRDDEWEVKLRVYDTMSTLDIRNKSDRDTWFAEQMVAVANYAEAFGLTFWLNNDKDYATGELWFSLLGSDPLADMGCGGRTRRGIE
jgi:hypothetical protein